MKKVDKEMLRNEFSKAWDSERMIDYCTNKVAAYATLPDGKIVVVDKESIETDFCFGESGYDYDDAQDMAAYASKSEEYFRKENMKHFDSWISSLEDVLETENSITSDYPQCMLGISLSVYTGQTEDCNLSGISWHKLCDVIDDCGGTANLYTLSGKILNHYGHKYRIATKEEIKLILEAYKEAAQAHEKKVNTYLKKYGMNHVRTWTYWRDA